ncbi:MAG: ATP-binding cassette domain-containing protein [Flavobacteriales bacterium]|nr:ATP-binding cassette domain-containing protein [Flavobacteriales bacterium]
MVEISGVSKSYGIQKALDDVHLTIRPGGVFGLLGPNGAGKSTLMKIITGYVAPDFGDVRVCGINVATDTVKARRSMGYLPENNPLYGDLYVREYLEFRAQVFGLKNIRHRVQEVIDQTGLGPEAHKKAGMLSRGYRQRLGLAAALLHQPEVLILDEPTSGLDPNQVQEIRLLIREMGSARIVIMSTHIMQEVEAICTRAAIIAKGRIRADESVDSLRRRGVGNVLNVQFEKHVQPSDLKSVQGVLHVRQNTDGKTFEITTQDSDIARKSLFDWAVTSQNPIVEITARQRTLEDVFQELTRD